MSDPDEAYDDWIPELDIEDLEPHEGQQLDEYEADCERHEWGPDLDTIEPDFLEQYETVHPDTYDDSLYPTPA